MSIVFGQKKKIIAVVFNNCLEWTKCIYLKYGLKIECIGLTVLVLHSVSPSSISSLACGPLSTTRSDA